MRVIIEQAEKALVARLQHIRAGYGNAACLHIQGCRLPAKSSAQLPALITQWVGHHSDGKILVCHDGDIFVFSPNITFNLFMKFRERFHERFKMENVAAAPELVSFYDIRINGAGLAELAQVKLERKQAIQKKLKEEAIQKNKKKTQGVILDMLLNADLAATISRRRNERRELGILIVEDDPFSRSLVGGSLSTQFSIAFAEDGQSAIASHLKIAPDVVFLDIDLPDVMGHEVLKKILMIDPAAYIVMLSGNGNAENIKKTMGSGAKGFIGKPFSKEKLLQYINKCPRCQPQPTGA